MNHTKTEKNNSRPPISKKKFKFLQKLLAILEKISPSGIQAKLAGFIGAVIALTIMILSIINLQQQNRILKESYDREAAFSRKYISSFVLEMDNIAQNLILIEQFRSRVKKQQEVLKKYQTVRTFSYNKKISLFGIKTNLFGAMGKGRFSRKIDTYYSEYLSDQDIKNLELKTRELLQILIERQMSDHEFAGLLNLARNFVLEHNNLTSLRQQLEEGEKSPDVDKLKAAAQDVSNKSKAMRLLLDKQISMLLSPLQKKKILELGLDTNRFRIQTFSAIALESGESYLPSLDTNIFDPSSPLNGDINVPALQTDMEYNLQSMLGTSDSKNGASPLEIQINHMNLQVQYSSHLRNPGSSIRLQHLLKVKGLKVLDNYLTEDINIGNELAGLAVQIKDRVQKLKTSKPSIPPNKDSEFRNLYKKYEALVNQRTSAYNELLSGKSQNLDPAVLDAVGYFREAALEDMILIYFKNSPSAYEEYIKSEEIRNARRKRWQAIRRWIYTGESENPPKALSSSFTEGMIGYSRTEAEENMWKLDSRPLLSEGNADVTSFVKEANFAGVIRTIINHTSGLEEIRTNRNQALLSALAITAFAIGFAVFLSTVVVKKIKKIIHSAEDVGEGNLNVEFESGGNDEFGNLTQVLNSMVTGLREREKIKGILGSMIDPVVIGEAMKDLQALKNGTEKKITSFFSDIAGFSSISEKLTSVELATLLNEYLSAMTIILKEHDGVLDKYIGDAMVGIFNAPVDVDNYTAKAVYASFRMNEKMKELKSLWIREKRYIPEAREMEFRIGLNTGIAKVGFMGTDALASYTMMGDTVNLASRLEAAAKDYGVTIMASQNVYDEVKDLVIARKLDLIRVKGKKEPVTIYELITDKDQRVVERGVQDSKILYEQGLELYLQRDWGKAIKTFQESEKIRGREDKAARMLIERIEHYRRTPPADDWDGAFTREHK